MDAEKLTAEILSQQFSLEEPADFSFEKLRNLLAERIDFLLKSDPEKLFSILYRIDISEAKSKEALESAGNPAEVMADLIVERQLQKVKTRMEFGRDQKGDW